MKDFIDRSPKTARSTHIKPTVFWRIAETIPRSLSWQLMVLSVIVPFCCWWLISDAIANSDYSHYLPTPVVVWERLVYLWQREPPPKLDVPLMDDIAASCFRVGVGFFLAAILSVPVGILMGAFASIRALLEPIIGIVRYMPVPALTPLLIIYFGVDEASKIALIFIGTFFFNESWYWKLRTFLTTVHRTIHDMHGEL